MDNRKKLGLGLLFLSIGIILGLICAVTELPHTADSVLSFLGGAGVGISLPMIASAYAGRKRG